MIPLATVASDLEGFLSCGEALMWSGGRQRAYIQRLCKLMPDSKRRDPRQPYCDKRCWKVNVFESFRSAHTFQTHWRQGDVRHKYLCQRRDKVGSDCHHHHHHHWKCHMLWSSVLVLMAILSLEPSIPVLTVAWQSRMWWLLHWRCWGREAGAAWTSLSQLRCTA